MKKSVAGIKSSPFSGLVQTSDKHMGIKLISRLPSNEGFKIRKYKIQNNPTVKPDDKSTTNLENTYAHLKKGIRRQLLKSAHRPRRVSCTQKVIIRELLLCY